MGSEIKSQYVNVEGIRLNEKLAKTAQSTAVTFVNASKEDLLDDFEDSPEIVKSGLSRMAYTAAYGQFGGQPFGAIISNYDFGPGAQDMKLLQNVASVSAMAHAPFIAAASAEFFGVDSFEELPKLTQKLQKLL